MQAPRTAVVLAELDASVGLPIARTERTHRFGRRYRRERLVVVPPYGDARA
ncbi:MAG: hypothetical protein ABJA87_00935 [bacterium]